MKIDINNTSITSTTGDMYVFAYSWTPEYCYGKTNYPGCENPTDYWSNYFTIHGLWPQYSAGGYPQDCTTEAYNPQTAKNIGSDILQYWPDVEYALSDPLYTSFWEHEWTKHGTCSGLTQQNYFQYAINLIKALGTPSSVTNAVGSTLSASTLRNDFGGATYVALQCTSGKYLSGAYTCWAEENGLPTIQIECPVEVQKEDTCTSSTLTIESL